MKIASYVIAGILGLAGLVFILGAQGQAMRFVLGGILLVSAGFLIYMTQMRPQVVQSTTVQKIDLSGDVNLEKMTCQNCSAPLSKESVEVKAGAIFVNCEHCGTSYQIEEAPKW